MQHRMQHRQLALKYERYMEQLIKLLCKQAPDEVEGWVARLYFPIEKCLKICKDN